MIFRSPRWLILAALVLLMALLAGACSRNSQSSATPTVPPGAVATESAPALGTESAPPQATAEASPVVDGTLSGTVATISDLHDNPDSYTGKTVLTHGYLNTSLNANVIVLSDASLNLLVLGAEGVLPGGLTTDEFIQVSGTVEPFDVQRAADELDVSFTGLDVARFAGEPSMIVSAIRAGAVPVGEVVADPDRFVDRTIAIGGSISSVIDARAFVLQPAGNGSAGAGMLVATPFAAVPAQLADQARVEIVGRVVRLDDATLSSLGEPFAFLTDSAFDAYRGARVFIGDVVDVVAPAPSATVEEVLAQPEDWEGKTVTVIDTVAARLTDHAVSIGPDGALMVVGTTDQLPESIKAGVTIVVNGAVTRFDPANPPDVAGFDPSHPALAAYDGKPIIVVTSVQVLPAE